MRRWNRGGLAVWLGLCAWASGAHAQLIRPGGLEVRQCTWTPPTVTYDETTTERVPTPVLTDRQRAQAAWFCGAFSSTRCEDTSYLDGLCYDYHRTQGYSCASSAGARVRAQPHDLTRTPTPTSAPRQALLSRASAPEAPVTTTYDPSSFASTIQWVAATWPTTGRHAKIAAMDAPAYPVHSYGSCFEYAYELHYDAAELRLAALRHAETPRALFDELYRPGGLAQRVSNGELRSRDGRRRTGNLFRRRARSAFFSLGSGGWASDPALRMGNASTWQILARNFLLAKLQNNYREVVPNFALHRALSEQYRTIARARPAAVPAGACGSDRTQGYTDEELDYLHALGRRFEALLERHRLVRVRPALTLPGRANPTQVALRAIEDELFDVLIEADSWGCLDAGNTACDWSPAQFAADLANPFDETLEDALDYCEGIVENAANTRPELSRVVLEVRECPHCYPTDAAACPLAHGPLDQCVMFDNLGCSDDDPLTPWYDENPETPCEEYYARYDLSENPSSLLAWPLIQSAYRNAQRRGLWVSSRAALVALDPHMVDESGAVRAPHFERSLSDTIGSDYFGLHYDVGVALDVGGPFIGGFADESSSESLCDSHSDWRMSASAHFRTDALILKQNIRLLDVAVNVRSDEHGRSEQGHWNGYGNLPVLQPSGRADATTFQVVSLPDTPLADVWVSVLGIPIHVRAGLAGRVGFSASFSAQETSCRGGLPVGSIRATITPEVSAHGYVSAAVDAFVARAGVKGELELLTASMPLSLSVSVDGEKLHMSNDASLHLSTLSGRIAAFAEINYLFGTESAEKTLV
ncbi:MAG: hypothetical protein KC586_08255, partial [Myxococcales bacterium]|nr:hypothetical protein [Myxococcales bacterium]